MSRKPANDNDKEYPVCDEHGRVFEWFLNGIADWFEGDEPDLGLAIGKRLEQAERTGQTKT